MRNQLVIVTSFLAVALIPHSAAAQIAGLEQVTTLASDVVTYIQGIVLILCALGLIFAGYMWNTGEPQAAQRAKGAVMGIIVTASAVVIVQVVKGRFGF